MKSMETNSEWMRKVGASFEELSKSIDHLIKAIKEQLMMPKVIIKSATYEKCEVKIENGDGITVEFTFVRKDVPTICKQILKAVLLVVSPDEVALGLSAITVYASKEVYSTLTKEYLIAPGKKLINMFENNGINIRLL